MIPNILCVAGAFVWGFTSLTSVMVTNLATYGIYGAIGRVDPKPRTADFKGVNTSSLSREAKDLTTRDADGESYGAGAAR